MKKIYNKLVRDKMIDIYKHDVENKISASTYRERYKEKGENMEKWKDKFIEESVITGLTCRLILKQNIESEQFNEGRSSYLKSHKGIKYKYIMMMIKRYKDR